MHNGRINHRLSGCCGGKIGEGDQLNRRKLLDHLQGETLDVAGFAQASVNPREVCVVVTRMGDQFPGSLWNMCEKSAKGRGIDRPGTGDRDGAIGSDEAFFRDDAPEVGPKPAQRPHLSRSHPGSAGGGVHRPFWLKGIAHRANSGSPRRAQNRAQNARKHVGVLVRIDVGEVKAALLQQENLCRGLGFDLTDGGFLKGPSALKVDQVEELEQGLPECSVDGVGEVWNIETW